MRIGVWSFAHMHGYSYLSSLSAEPGVELVGVADEDGERGRRLAGEQGTAFFERPDDLLAQVDAVIITSANADHLALGLRAAEAGVHVLMEKPLTTRVADAWALVRAFERAGLTLATAFPCPFSPAFVELQEAIHTGALGQVWAYRTTNHGSMPGGFFIQLERSGGGAVIDHTVHVADLLRRLTRGEVTQVYAEIGHGLFHEEWDDSGLLTLDLSDGSFATLDCSWSRPKTYPTWGDVTIRAVGERGNALADLFVQHVNLYPAENAVPKWQGWGSNLDALMVHDFVTAIREKRPPRSTGLDGLRALEVALAAYESAKLGRPVRIEQH